MWQTKTMYLQCSFAYSNFSFLRNILRFISMQFNLIATNLKMSFVNIFQVCRDVKLLSWFISMGENVIVGFPFSPVLCVIFIFLKRSILFLNWNNFSFCAAIFHYLFFFDNFNGNFWIDFKAIWSTKILLLSS